MREEYLNHFTKATGYTFPEEDKHSIDDLNEIPEKFISWLKEIDHPVLPIFVLQFLTTLDNHDHIRHFIQCVITGDEDVKSWGRGRTWLPDFGLVDALTKRINELFPIDTEITHFVDPNPQSWEQASCVSGCPAIRWEDATYKTPHIRGMHNYLSVKIRPKSEFNQQVIHARWIAQYIARCLDFQSENVMLSELDLKAETAKFASSDDWIPEVYLALQGLSKEIEAGLIEADKVPGFAGPDEFYQSA